MKEKPILFNTEMVRAALEGRKTQTRRVIKSQPDEDGISFDKTRNGWFDTSGVEYKCPYGQPGDELWVRETWAASQFYDSIKASDINHSIGELSLWFATDPFSWSDSAWTQHRGKWRPSIFMPRWASRIQLVVKNIRVERIQSIDDQEVIKEGIRCVTKDGVVKKYCVYDKGDYCSVPWCDMPRVPRDAFQSLWNSINKKRGYGWDKDPWVWVVEFEVKK